MNAAWHSRHPMPRKASLDERIAWHRAHQRHCACRPVPRSIAPHTARNGWAVKRATTSARRSTRAAPLGKGAGGVAPNFDRLVREFETDPRVTYGGKGFGATALKVDGKIFAMLTPRGEFVVKLPAARVNELVDAGKGTQFQPGPGRVMKEWLTVTAKSTAWLALAREARSAANG